MSINPVILITASVAAIFVGKAILSGGLEARPDVVLNAKEHFLLHQLNVWSHGYSGLLIGLLCLLSSWVVSYFNWFHIGGFPCTPLSPHTSSTIGTNSCYQSADAKDDVQLAYFTPILVSIATAAIVLWNSS